MSLRIDVPELEAMERPELVALWREAFGRPAPKKLSRSFLHRFLAFEIQSRRFGGLSREAASELTQKTPSASPPKSPTLKPGGRLLREWNGVTHVVDVGGDGFSWNGHSYRSLSAIAREITGARWSGPRFFGLTGTSPR